MQNIQYDDIIMIGKCIQKLRRKHGLTQPQLAEKVGCHWRTISHYENGRNTPSLSMLFRMAEALQAPVGDLITEEKVVS